ncbi:MAG: Glu/Leu/Phe/Val dehydrogenase dimerization domain-containing protein [Planctomycetota bacterium]
MVVQVLESMSREGFEEVIALHDRRSGARAFLAIHDTSVGPAFGGIRRFAYRDEKEGLLDCLRLALAMSYKCALTDIAGGGAKMVLFDRPYLDLPAAYRFLGESVAHLGGRYYAGPDVGTGWRELAWVGETTQHVTLPGPGGPGDLAGATCAGVFAGMRAALRAVFGAEDWPARTIVVQGLGSVGKLIAERLRDQGARVIAAEIDPERREAVRRELGIECVDAGGELDRECDVFCPCAMGGILHDLSVPRLRARVVCGSANNLLARTMHGDRLHERGILYAPDFVVNSGAVMRGAEFHLTGRPTPLAEVEARIGHTTTEILRMAAEEAVPTARIALREANRRIRLRRELGQAVSAAREATAASPPTDD